MSSTRKYEFRTLGFNLDFTGPATAEEIGRIVGNPAAAAEAFMRIYAYQDRNVSFREKFAEGLEALTGQKRLSHEETSKKDGTVSTKFDETEQDFYNRLLVGKAYDANGELTVDIPKLDPADASKVAYEVNATLGDWSPSVGSDRKPAQPYYELADAYLGKIATGEISPTTGEPVTADSISANLEAKLGVSFAAQFGDFNRDNLARALKAWDEKKKQLAKSELG